MTDARRERIEKIALHRYKMVAQRLLKASQLEARLKSGKRFMLDSTGINTRIVRSTDSELLVSAYVTRRVVCTGRLLMLFEWLRQNPPSALKQPALHWSVASTEAVVQLTPSVGGNNASQACHTAPTQVKVAGQYPWVLAQAAGIKNEFVLWFGDIYVMPTAVNQADIYIETCLGNREMFVEAVENVLRGQPALAVLQAYVHELKLCIDANLKDVSSGHDAVRQGLLLIYGHTLLPAGQLAGQALKTYADELKTLSL